MSLVWSILTEVTVGQLKSAISEKESEIQERNVDDHINYIVFRGDRW